MLSFKEELFILLHLNPKKGALVKLTPNSSELIAFGGILVELMLSGRVCLEEDQLAVTDTSPTGDDILDEAITQLAPAQPVNLKKPEWLLPIAQRVPIGHRLFACLLEKGVLTQQKERAWFGLSQTTIYPVAAGVIQQIIEHERDVMLRGAKPDPHMAALLFMNSVWGGASLNAGLSPAERRTHQTRWEALFGDYWGAYPMEQKTEPIEGLDPALRSAIGVVAISWTTIQTRYVSDDYAIWHHLRDIHISEAVVQKLSP